MTLSEMKSSVRTQLNESGTEFYSDADIAASLQEGLDEMADLTEYFERYANIPVKTGHTYYDLRTVLPDTFLSPRRIWNSTTQRWLRPTDARDLDDHNFVQWELTSGQPEAYFVRGSWWLGTWPKASSDVGQLRFVYTAIPDDLENQESPAFPREFHAGIVDYAVYDLMAQQRETAKAMKYWESFLLHAARLGQHVQKRQQIARRDIL